MSVKGAIPLFSTGLFICCMVCHGELVQLRPHPRYLTSFYLMISAGGALGGILVGLVAPNLFPGFFELQIGLAGMTALVVLRFRQSTGRWAVLTLAACGLIGYLGLEIHQSARSVRSMGRNFYGALKVRDSANASGTQRIELHGAINHGQQFLDGQRRGWATSYYGKSSGVGIAIGESASRGPIRVGVIGLGAGTLAAYGRPGDYYRFYEINPLVANLARTQFTFLADSRARVDVVLGDGRLSLEREPSQQFDVLVVDAFSGDSIPVHLLTQEAFQLYFRHLQKRGTVAVHVTNKYLDLAPVVNGIAAELGKCGEVIEGPGDPASATFPSTWVLVNGQNDRPDTIHSEVTEARASKVWSDDYSNLFRVLR